MKGNSMGLILEARSSTIPFVFPFFSSPGLYLMGNLRRVSQFSFLHQTIWKSHHRCLVKIGRTQIIRSGDDIPINRVKHRGDCFGNKTVEDYERLNSDEQEIYDSGLNRSMKRRGCIAGQCIYLMILLFTFLGQRRHRLLGVGAGIQVDIILIPFCGRRSPKIIHRCSNGITN